MAGAKRQRADGGAEAPAAYLQRIGQRVRNARNRRGMARKDLARESGVSERYLAQLEAGRGNISILLLRRIAQAMGASLGTLVRDGAARPVEKGEMDQWVPQPGPEPVAEAP